MLWKHPTPEVITCLRSCTVPGMGECLEYYDAFGVWTKECNNLIDECGCGEDEPTHPGETPIDRDMRDCALNCSNDAFNCWSIFHETGEWSEACKDIMRNCDCYDPDDQHDCYRKALNYIKNELILEPYSNACAVLEYVLTHFNCIPRPLDPNEPGIPGDLPDDWDDDGGTDPDPGATDGPYDEDQRKPIWWYHSDHLGSSTYLTDNFGRPSHYYETLPFGEMIVEHNQSSFYDNKFKFNGKELDDATQMYYYGARYYDPRISIFISVDPLAEEFVGWTPYHYVHQNPINLIDPTGMSAEGPPVHPIGGFVMILRLSLAIKEARDKYKAHGAGGFVFYDGDNKTPSGDHSTLRKGTGEWIDFSGFIRAASTFGPKSPTVSKAKSGPYATKSKALLEHSRKFVEGVETGKRIEDGINSVNSFIESQSRDIEVPYTLNLIDTIKLSDQTIIDKKVEVNVKGKSLLEIKNKLDSLESINERESSLREAYIEGWKKSNENGN